MPSFDIVSVVDKQEVDNAVNQAIKEIGQRYDFKGAKTEVTLEKDAVKVVTDDEFRLKAAVDVLQSKFVRRGVSLKSLEYGKVEPSSGGRVRQVIAIRQGISKEKGREIIALIKGTKRKVQGQIQEEQVRVTAKDIDDLQEIIRLLKGKELGVDLQFVNMRS